MERYDELIKLHILPMYIAWMIVIPFSIIIARLGSRFEWWFPIHIISNFIALILVIIGITFGIQFSQGNHFHHPHQILGITTFILLLLQFIGGILIGFIFPQREIPEKLHWWTGRIVIFMAFISIFLGMLWMQFETWIFILVGITIIIYTILYLLTMYFI